MRLIELEIKNIRGIKDLTLELNGENLLVWGPNGSGKSGVVDAIDFLLTGNIARLTGEGTGDITLNRHGKHVDNQDLGNSRVRAIVKLPFSGDKIELIRCMDKPGILKFPKGYEQEVEKILSLAIRGQHILTRREILKYITAESKTRAVQIQSLLNLSQIENIRSSLTYVANSCNKTFEQSQRNLISCKDRISEIIGDKTFSEEIVLRKINNNREILSAKPIQSIDHSLLKSEITHLQTTPSGKTVSISNFSQDIDNIKSIQSEETKKVIRDNKEILIQALDQINSNPGLIEILKRKKLIELGLELIDESDSCPLCDTVWEEGRLKEYLGKKYESVKSAEVLDQTIKDRAFNLNRIIDRVNTSIERVISVIKENEQLRELKDDLTGWNVILNEIHSMLNSYADLYTIRDTIVEKLHLLIGQNKLIDLLDRIFEQVKKNIPESSPEHEAWDNLTRLEEHLKNYETYKTDLDNDELVYRRSSLLLSKFLESRDFILSDLYRTIQERFVELYRHLHGPDEEKFDAELRPEEAGLYIGVDFYGRGKHPPHALHSEGHQDSMGLCLYLALSDKLNQDIIDLIILDDVVMSVDSDHRKNVCSLLKKYYPDKQLIITTHDKTWASQIRHMGVAKSNQCIEFYNWHIDIGPRLNKYSDMWERIKEYLSQADVPSASFQLRRGLEEFLSLLCDSLRSSIRYDINGINDFNEFLQSAVGQYNSLLKKAKAAAQTWQNQELFEFLTLQEDTSKQIYKRAFGEQWAININVHYNDWANFTVAEFRPVVEAFQDLCGLFSCTNCKSIIRLVTADGKDESVRCNCGTINWNLISKPKDS